MAPKDQIIGTLSAHAAAIAAFGVRRIGLFGSYARAEQTPESDIDLLVDFEPDLENFDNFMGLCDYLENLFPKAKLEVLTVNGLSKHLGPGILQEVAYVQVAS
jgi:uncharacterized protein